MEVREPNAKYLERPAYKQTEVGVIPEDWDVSTIADLANTSSGTTPSRAQAERYFGRGNIPWVKTLDLNNGSISETEEAVTPTALAETSLQLYPDGAVLVAMYGGYNQIGRTGLLKIPATINQALTAICPDVKRLDAGYLLRALNYRIDYWRSVASSSRKDPNITSKDIREFPLALPQLAEQQAIAEVLSDADALIEALEQLLAKKRQIKQGAMQELLIGQKRLPGFAGEWEVRSMQALGQTYGGLTGKCKTDFGQGNARYIPFMNVMSGTVIDPAWLELVNVASGESQNSAQMGDLFFNGSSETPEEVGFCSVLMHEIGNLYLNSFCFGFRLHPGAKANGLFLAYWFRSRNGRKAMAILAQGATRYNIAKSAFLKLEISLPSEQEQTAIATVLSDMDAELAALEVKLAKARSLKQGMMQELLTGRIRLVPSVAEVIPFPVQEKNAEPARDKPHNWQINEAVVISVLAKHFGSEQWPLGRKRYTKLSYLLHRHVERQAEGYLKKAAGPYNPATKYKGPEGIALRNGYIRQHVRDQFSGFVAAEKIGEAEDYFLKWYGADVLTWLKQFRMEKNDELELLATVDMAVDDLRRAGSPVTLSAVKQIIESHPEWQAKLDRPIFSDANIERAIARCHNLFRD